MLTLSEIKEQAQLVAKSSLDDDVKDLALLLAELAEGLSRGGGATWPKEQRE